MTSLKERFSTVLESVFLASVLAWSVLVGAAAVSNPATQAPRASVEIRALDVGA